MLIKYDGFLSACADVKLTKTEYSSEDPAGEDVSRRGAFALSAIVRFRMILPRRLGVTGVIMRVHGDDFDVRGDRANGVAECGISSQDFLFEFEDSRLGTDSYTLELPMRAICADEDGGLFFYELVLMRGSDSLFISSLNNVDFTLTTGSPTPFKLLVYRDDYTTPKWFGRGIIYHIFVDRYAIGCENVSIRDDAIMNNDWRSGIKQYGEHPGAPVKNNEFFGGNLWGIIERLDYIAALGVGTIYLSPIFEAYSNHKYDTGDYEKIDGMFGGEEAFDALVRAAGEYGIKVILDGVFNHTGDDSRYFDRYGKYGGAKKNVGAYNSTASPYSKWFTFIEHPDRYKCWWDIKILPKLNHENDECREYFAGAEGIGAAYVLRGTGGWRLDVADELSDGFLDEFRRSVKGASGGEAVIIGEVWENAADKIAYGRRRRYLCGGQLDGVMNYPVRSGIINFVLYKDSKMLYNTLTEICSMYPPCALRAMMNLLGTHDTERILTALADAGTDTMTNSELAVFRLGSAPRAAALKRLMVASVILYTLPGVTSLYYGDEVGMEGGRDPFCRQPFPWGRENTELLWHYRRLGKIRSGESVFDGVEFRFLIHAKEIIAYERSAGGEAVIVAANSGELPFELALDGRYAELMSGETFSESINIAPMSAVILKKI